MDRPLITWAEVTLDYCDTERAATSGAPSLTCQHARNHSRDGSK